MRHHTFYISYRKKKKQTKQNKTKHLSKSSHVSNTPGSVIKYEIMSLSLAYFSFLHETYLIGDVLAIYFSITKWFQRWCCEIHQIAIRSTVCTCSSSVDCFHSNINLVFMMQMKMVPLNVKRIWSYAFRWVNYFISRWNSCTDKMNMLIMI